ncbi:MAG: UDP-glucose 4-epimerase GalE, partial [Sphingobacterium sp.]
EAINAFQEASGQKLNYAVGPRRAGDIIKVWGDVSKSSKELGWKAELGIQEMMSSAWAWEQYLKENPID